MRIFIGLEEIANIAAALAQGFQALGHNTYTVVWRRNRYYPEFEYDTVVVDSIPEVPPESSLASSLAGRLRRRILVTKEFLRTQRSCDLFIFIFGTSFLPHSWDYPLLRYSGKQIVSIFCGSDILHWYAYEQEMRSIGIAEHLEPYLELIRKNPSLDNYSGKIRKIRAAEKHVDLILSQPSIAQLQMRPYNRLNIPLDLSQFIFNIPQRSIPVVLHAPSKRQTKGTSQIIEIVEQLKEEEFEFEFRLVEEVKNPQLRAMLTEADIVVDQLFSQTVATLALESMATGNAVLANYNPRFAGIPDGCPVVAVTTDTLKDKLRELIVDIPLRLQLAQDGAAYVRAYHSHIRIAESILDVMTNAMDKENDFTPTFFRDQFVMPPHIKNAERSAKRRRRIERARLQIARFLGGN